MQMKNPKNHLISRKLNRILMKMILNKSRQIKKGGLTAPVKQRPIKRRAHHPARTINRMAFDGHMNGLCIKHSSHRLIPRMLGRIT